jgi:hypothetical protein
MAKSPKKMAMGGAFMGNDAPLIRDTALIEGRDYPVGGNESNNYLMPKRSAADIAQGNAMAEATMNAEMLRRGQDARGVSLGTMEGVPGNSSFQQAAFDRGNIDNNGMVSAKNGGKIAQKKNGKSAKSGDWHGFGSGGKTGKNNHGF